MFCVLSLHQETEDANFSTTSQNSNERYETESNGKSIHSTSTDFENLIEMNARERNIDPSSVMLTKVIPVSNGSPTADSEPGAATSPHTVGHYKCETIDQSPPTTSHLPLLQHAHPQHSIQMDVDDSSAELRSQSTSPISHISATSGSRVNKVKIVVDNMTPKATVNMVKFGMQTCSFEVNKEHLHYRPESELYYQHPAFHQLCPSNGYAPFPAYYYYEHNQNNQNLLNQNACDAKSGETDESMWRPW